MFRSNYNEVPDSDDDLFFEAHLDDNFDSNKNLNPSAITETDDPVPKSTEIINTSEHKSVPKVNSTQKRKLNEIRKTGCAERFKKLKKFQADSKPSVTEKLKNDEVDSMTVNSSFVKIENCTIGHLTIYKNQCNCDKINNP
ncbi:hypothetical protein KQX54_008871 [Cotesia glomerata]|uniref:Uncharacterized protein n=1 Tax=Cotesia glomerata TaxID=32391 RepID=A0AAV7IX22_COTGL|nr:hypothetical protein KQX54_008871 [Cotesia glomerata]